MIPNSDLGQLMANPLQHTAANDFNNDGLPDFLICEELRPLTTIEGLVLIFLLRILSYAIAHHREHAKEDSDHYYRFPQREYRKDGQTRFRRY